MVIDLDNAMEWAAARSVGTLITIRSDARPQSSDIVYGVQDGTFLISVTADRAKTANMRRDPRVVLHISDPSSWSYVSFDGTAELTDPTTSPGDETSDELVAYYRLASGEHDDWEEYRRAMVAQRRLVARFTPTSAVGQVH